MKPPAGLIRAVVVAGLLGASAAAAAQLTLEQAVALARSQDPWLEGSRHRERAMQAESVAAGALPDPVLSLGVVNLPTDNFAFGQAPMTQFKVGVNQMFPRGDTRALRRRQLRERGAEQPPFAPSWTCRRVTPSNGRGNTNTCSGPGEN